MTERSVRVVVLARPGPACDRIVEGLVEAGADVVRAVDPLAVDVETLDGFGPDAVVVALEPAIEDALDGLAPALECPGRAVVFEEAALVLERSGWDAARWVRHLGEKLHLRPDALPSGAGAQTQTPLAPDEAASAMFADASVHAFDPVAAEYGEYAESQAAPDATFAAFAFDLEDAPRDAVAGVGDDAVDTTAADAVLPVEARPTEAPPSGAQGDDALPTAPPLSDIDALPSFRHVADTDPLPQSTQVARDLADLEHRISGLSLADTDSYGHGPQRGLVLVEGGLGGPDAVRQLLAALPEGFPRPILVRLRLDGGRYDRLVGQMTRVTAAPVQLAEPGMSIIAGEVYFLPPDLQPARAGGALRFGADGALDALAQAVPTDDSAWVLLSGADAALVDLATGPAWQGALVAAQSEPGCYDPAAAHALAARGGRTGTPAQIAAWLVARWMPEAAPGSGDGALSL